VIKPHSPRIPTKKKRNELKFPKFGFDYYCRRRQKAAGDVDVPVGHGRHPSAVLILMMIVPFRLVGRTTRLPILRNPKSVCASTLLRVQFFWCLVVVVFLDFVPNRLRALLDGDGYATGLKLKLIMLGRSSVSHQAVPVFFFFFGSTPQLRVLVTIPRF
jgi:hypothetical protein